MTVDVTTEELEKWRKFLEETLDVREMLEDWLAAEYYGFAPLRIPITRVYTGPDPFLFPPCPYKLLTYDGATRSD